VDDLRGAFASGEQAYNLDECVMLGMENFMNTRDILLAIDAEIAKLQQVKAILNEGSTVERRPGRPAKVSSIERNSVSAKTAKLAQRPEKRRTMSAAGRARIAAAQKARWAKLKGTARKATSAKKVVQSTALEKKA
jgi:hypothetical protein